MPLCINIFQVMYMGIVLFGPALALEAGMVTETQSSSLAFGILKI